LSVTAASGFVASGVHAGIRRSGPDLAVVRSLAHAPAVGAAVWTTNRVLAAPVVVSKRHLETTEPQAVVVNAGVANAATGNAGIAHAERTATEVAGQLGVDPQEVVVLSTGVIGVSLPIERVLVGVRRACAVLGPDGGDDAARAILTTDRWPKQAQARGDGFVVGGMAKGAGMIHPRLATMLAIVTTDYPLDAGEPSELLRAAADTSFNRISVDGECSTNDAVVLLANGASGVERTSTRDAQFADALGEVCAALAREIVADGEGSTVVLEITVSGAASGDEAAAVARRIATSPLVKTAAFGRDPNWGRVLAAAGSAPWNGGFAHVDADRLTVAFDGTPVFARGEPTGERPELGGTAVAIDLDLGLGSGSASYLASDLTHDYVRLNAEYTT
jgi:glutamate N-acetyltransferase / amino-acid N-acetyltransferase